MILTRECMILALIVLYISKTLQQKSLKDFPEECFTATAIYDDSRVFENNLVRKSIKDDLRLIKGWYRFAGKSANSLKQGFGGPLPGNKDNPHNVCGTLYPGTLMSTHPTEEEGIAAIVVCFREKYCFYDNIKACQCKSKKMIYVRNCRRHFIYWLVPTGRHERYCTSKTWLIKPMTSTNISDALECTQYKTVRDPSRIWNTLSKITAENEEGWVRFDKITGSEVATQCIVNKERISQRVQPCGAKFRGWMIDSHPSLLEGRVNRRVCFSYADQCSCEMYSNIAVRNCGIFFVYYLHKPPIDNARYCGASLGSHSVINNLRKPYFERKNICNVSKGVYGIDRLWSNTNPTIFKCDANLFGVYRFGYKDIPLAIKEGCNKTDMLVIGNRCATRYQGFMEGRHPTVSEGYVERIICFQYNLVPCECYFTTVIGVQNCGDSYAYDLKGVSMCDARFCMVLHTNADVVMDTLSQSVYGIPSNYEPNVAPLKEKSSNDIISDDQLSVTNLLLSFILLLFCILLVVLILVIVCVVRPLLKEKSQQ